MTTMKMETIGRYRFSNKIQSLSILNQFLKQSNTGCLQIFSDTTSWSIYLEEGKLIYASYSLNMFELLYRKLQQLSRETSSIYGEIYKRLLARFETAIESQEIPNLDYLAICWLVNEKFISHIQAGILIEQLSLEIVGLLLNLEEGYYEFTTESFLDDMPKFCHLDLSLLLIKAQQKSPKQQNKQSQEVTSQEPLRALNKPIEQAQVKTNTESLTVSKKQLAVASQSLAKSSYNDGNTHKSIYQLPTAAKKVYKVVCIDDSPTVLNVIEQFLDDDFFTIITITEPLKALMQIIRTKPDIILLDIGMPNLDGYELCSLLRKHSYLKNIPVIMVTGRNGFIDKAKAKMVRASGYLTKPFTQGELLKTIFQHLE